jgi:hypothetical protein
MAGLANGVKGGKSYRTSSSDQLLNLFYQNSSAIFGIQEMIWDTQKVRGVFGVLT